MVGSSYFSKQSVLLGHNIRGAKPPFCKLKGGFFKAIYRIVGNFRGVQCFAVFAESFLPRKKEPVNFLNT